VGQYGRALKHASAELKRDRAVLLAAVGQKGGALCYASAQLQYDAEIKRVAAEQIEAAEAAKAAAASGVQNDAEPEAEDPQQPGVIAAPPVQPSLMLSVEEFLECGEESLPQYAAQLAHLDMLAFDDAALLVAGVREVSHRKRLLRWQAQLRAEQAAGHLMEPETNAFLTTEDGGQLVVDDGQHKATLTIPPGALLRSESISIRQLGNKANVVAAFDAACDRCLPVYELLPHGTMFQAEVTLSIELAADGDAHLLEGAAALRSTNGTDCELVEKRSRDGKTASITVQTFSWYSWGKWAVRLQVLYPKTKHLDGAAENHIYYRLVPTEPAGLRQRCTEQDTWPEAARHSRYTTMQSNQEMVVRSQGQCKVVFSIETISGPEQIFPAAGDDHGGVYTLDDSEEFRSVVDEQVNQLYTFEPLPGPARDNILSRLVKDGKIVSVRCACEQRAWLGGRTPGPHCIFEIVARQDQMQALSMNRGGGIESDPVVRFRMLHIKNVSVKGSEELAASLNTESEQLAVTASASGSPIGRENLHREECSKWIHVDRILGWDREWLGTAASGWLVVSGHDGPAFDGQPDGAADCAAVIAEAGAAIVVINTCNGGELAVAIQRHRPATAVVFWEGTLDTHTAQQLPPTLAQQLGTSTDIEELCVATARQIGCEPRVIPGNFAGSPVLKNCLQLLSSADRELTRNDVQAVNEMPAATAQELEDQVPAELRISPLSAETLYEQMCETRVIFSFGAWGGGLQLAKQVRKDILGSFWKDTLDSPDEPAPQVYIDAVNLTSKTPGYFEKKDANGNVVRNALGEVIKLNDHWAELYYMGVLLAQTVIVVLDPAWLASPNCQEELELLKKNFELAHRDAQRRRFPGSRFQLVVLYDDGAIKAGLVRLVLQHEQPDPALMALSGAELEAKAKDLYIDSDMSALEASERAELLREKELQKLPNQELEMLCRKASVSNAEIGRALGARILPAGHQQPTKAGVWAQEQVKKWELSLADPGERSIDRPLFWHAPLSGAYLGLAYRP
jgi:hypothetical protein